VIDGGAGNDQLSGGAGNDTYLFGRGSGADTVSDYDSTAGNTDLLSIGTGVATNQLWFRRVGADLEVSIIGGTDKSTFSNWYSGSAYHVEQFKTSDGKMLLDSQVDALVSAMAAFAPPAAGQTTLPADYQTALNPVIAANWK
jgi:Ca2+-binding RTX toxin-like protein